MTQDERDFILQSSRRVEWHENAPRPLDEVYCDMTPQELIRLTETLQRMLRESEQRYNKLFEQIVGLNDNVKTLTTALKESNSKLVEKDRLIEELRKMMQSYEDRLRLSNKERFGSKSQKGPSKPKAQPERTHQQDKDDFDGTPGAHASADYL